MTNQWDTISYKKKWFDWEKYIKIQKEKILERVKKFNWRLYLEIWWKFLFDAHASRVLPWFNPESKKIIFKNLEKDIIFCINSNDIINNRQLSNENIKYEDFTINMIKNIKKELWIKPFITINMLNYEKINEKIDEFEKRLKDEWFTEIYYRYNINWYPKTKNVLWENWYIRDEYIPVKKNLVLVTGVASNSWKLSTCLWQLYHEQKKWLNSWYAKYETFPVWNLELNHPVNLAYEAATADIWDYNEIDPYYKKHYNKFAVNYNRDIEAFEIIIWLLKKIISDNNYMQNYNSPTDMWISNAGFCIIDDNIIREASCKEINRRIKRYNEMLKRWDINKNVITRCKKIKNKCK